ncbi:unnamed protein product [Calicophoron daubneyi]|uniref:Protein phosphatase 1 regulatory inhibitor subunit 16B n=1 Tax=Calicophoron daubneyi TaxID=300641 RepID=A0AAV2T2H5_CALDB
MKKMDGPVALAAEQNGVPTNSSAEVPQIRVPDLERIRNARRGRMLQLKEWQQYDRKMTRESEKLQRKGLAQSTERNYFAPGRTVKFPQSLIFLEAAARGDLDEVRKLLSNGVCPDVANEDGLTALHQCCIDNVPEMCRLLLRFGANPNARDTEKWTPLHAAATCEHTELCGILIAHGADLLAMNADGNMPYECCQPGPTLSLIETEMDKRGITQEELDDLHRLPECQMLADMETLYKAGKDLNGLDSQGASLLHIAAACGYEEVTIFLLKHGAKIDLLDRDGWQAIHIAACWGHLEVIERLVNFGADIMAKTTSGESVFDICEDDEMHARLTEIKEEMERKQFQAQSPQNRSGKQRELVRRRSSNNPRTASIRRSSMREKKMMSWKEAKQEAEMRGVTTANLGNADEWSGGQDATKLNNTAPTKTETYPPSPALPKIRSPPRINSPASSDSAYSPPLTSPDQSGLSSNFGTSPSPDYNNSSRPDRLHPLPPLNTHGHTRQPNGATSPPNPRPTTNRQADKNFPKSARSDRFPMSSGDSASSAFIRNRESDQKPSAKILSHPSSHYGQEMNHISIPHSRAVQRPGDPLNVTELSPSPKPRATGNDRNSPFINRRKQTGGIITSASPQPNRKTESVKRRPQEEVRPKVSDTVPPDLAVHNAYYTPPPVSLQNQSPFSPQPSYGISSPQTGKKNPHRLNQSTQEINRDQNTTVHAKPWSSKKQNMELIEYDSDPKSSGKCCILM